MQSPIGAASQEAPTSASKPNVPFDDSLNSSSTPIGSHWTRLSEVLLEKDNARCEIWKGEFQNALIFAGLFSAVVTAFLVESYKWLKKDPVEILLTHLLIQMGEQNPQNLFTDTLSIPDGAATLVNSLWFVSLVLSLATVLVGTACLQWLGEHQRSHAGVEPQIAFSLRHMQVEALDTWFVPRIFPSLCFILQAAVILFLIGLTVLLWILNHTVCTYVAVVVAVTLFFLLSTTVLPTLQALSLFIPQSVVKPRSPCPYKAPQAWAFHWLVSILVKSFSRAFGRSRKWSKLDARNLLSAHARGYHDGGHCFTFPHATEMLFRTRRDDSWIEHGIAWLFQRDSDYMDSRCSTKFEKVPVPLYDAVQGLLDIKNSELVNFKTTVALNHCIGIVLRSNGAPATGLRTVYGEFFKRLSTEHPLSFGLPHDMIDHVDAEEYFDVLASDAALRLCSRTDSFQLLPSAVGRRALRSCIDITEWMYGRDDATPYKTPEVYVPPRTLPIQFVAGAVANNEVAGRDLEEVQRRIRAILDRFLSRIAESKSTLGCRDSLDTHDQYVARFLQAAIRILSYSCDGASCDKLLEGLKLDRQALNPDFTYQVRPFLCYLLLDSSAPFTYRLQKSVEAAYSNRDEGRRSRNLPLWRFIRWEMMSQALTPSKGPTILEPSTIVSHTEPCVPGSAHADDDCRDHYSAHHFRSDSPYSL